MSEKWIFESRHYKSEKGCAKTKFCPWKFLKKHIKSFHGNFKFLRENKNRWLLSQHLILEITCFWIPGEGTIFFSEWLIFPLKYFGFFNLRWGWDRHTAKTPISWNCKSWTKNMLRHRFQRCLIWCRITCNDKIDREQRTVIFSYVFMFIYKLLGCTYIAEAKSNTLE